MEEPANVDDFCQVAAKRIKINSNAAFASPIEPSLTSSLASTSSTGLMMETTTTTNLDSLPLDIIQNHILPHVGPNQYRWMCSINRTFRCAYLTLFDGSKKTSHSSVSSVPLAQLCLSKRVAMRPPMDI
jgi:hypothetical protein